ncbi:MAG: diacylglycerol kinase family protein [Prevotellaceae bacterium]|jgi:diacylglycerol kinase|nr:diacylglycerol kinase family protein [Prevotellaceae bacterium]
MKTKQSFSIHKRLKSFTFAVNGLKILLREEHNAQIHLAITICVTIIGFLLQISLIEWIAVVLCIGLVFALELVNSAVENMCDFISPEKNEMIKKVKDLSAAAVLVAAACSVIVGLIVFLPKIIALIV